MYHKNEFKTTILLVEFVIRINTCLQLLNSDSVQIFWREYLRC